MSLAAQVLHLARRSVIRTARQPANWITPLVFPVALMAVNTGGLEPGMTVEQAADLGPLMTANEYVGS